MGLRRARACVTPISRRLALDDGGALGVLVSLLPLPPPVARMDSEEAPLESEFGERYPDYPRRTRRLLPFLS